MRGQRRRCIAPRVGEASTQGQAFCAPVSQPDWKGHLPASAQTWTCMAHEQWDRLAARLIRRFKSPGFCSSRLPSAPRKGGGAPSRATPMPSTSPTRLTSDRVYSCAACRTHGVRQTCARSRHTPLIAFPGREALIAGLGPSPVPRATQWRRTSSSFPSRSKADTVAPSSSPPPPMLCLVPRRSASS